MNDDWRVTPRLTVTAGVRYEYEYVPPPNFPNITGNGITGLAAAGPVLQTLNKPDDRNNIGPRIGFNYNIFGNGKTTLRGGYGLYYGRIINSNILQTYLLSGSPLGQVDYQPSSSNPCPGLTFPNVFPSAQVFLSQCQSASAANGGINTSTIAFLDKHLQNPQVNEIDLALEQNVGWNTSVSVSYMGSLGRELAAAVDQNISAATGSRSFEVLNSVQPPTPGYVVYPHGGKAPPLVANSIHTYKAYLSANTGPYTGYYHVLDFKSQVNSSYHALVLQLNHRFSHDFSLLSNYTYANTMDGNPYLSTGYGGSNELLDPLNPGGDYGRSNLQVRNRFVAAGTYRTNFLGLKGWEKRAANGWGIAPIVQMQGGLPFSPGVTQSISGTLYGGILGAGGTTRVPDLGRNSFTMPRTATVDLRLSKSFYLTDTSRFRFEIVGEAFNLLNHQNITSVNTTAYCLSNAVPTTTPSTGVACKPVVAGSTVVKPPTGTTYDYLVANPLFGTYLNSNSNTLLTPRQLQIAGRLYF